MRILIVEDEIKIRMGISRLISAHTQHTVVGEAKNGKEGLEMISRFHPELVISDLRMPVMDGLEMLQESVKMGNTCHFVILSGYSEFEYAQTAIRYGVDDYLLKPLAPEDVTQLLDKIQKKIDQEEAENIYPGKGYKLHKSLIICGGVGVGKTLTMQAFSEYLKMTGNPNAFHNVSVTQMINYYKQHEHLDLYTYNEGGRKGYDGCQPENLCLNDVGVQTSLHFGQDTKQLVMDFFHARTEVYNQYRVKTHVTTNMSPSEIKDYFSNDEYGRLVDRLKFYNIIHMNGESRRK